MSEDQIRELLLLMNESELRAIIYAQVGKRPSRDLGKGDLIKFYLGQKNLDSLPEDCTLPLRKRMRAYIEENYRYIRSQLECDCECVEGTCTDIDILSCVREMGKRLQ